MSEFKLNTQNDNIFITNFSEIEGRFDSEFYTPNNSKLISKLKSKPYYKLWEIVDFSNDLWNQKDYFNDTFPYIEISSINLSDGQIKKIREISINEAPSRAKKIVRKNDIIISLTRPTRGAISILENIENLKICSTGFSVINNVDESKIKRKTLFNILRMSFVLQQMGQRSSGGNYPAITQEELGKIIIPKLNQKEQEKIVSLYNKAYHAKQQKEKEAKDLLASIDTYLLDELGIELPEKDNSLKNRIFTASISEISGGRFDPFYLTNCLNLPISTKFEETEIYDIAKVEKGQSITSTDAINGKYPVIAGGQSSPYRHNKFNQNKNVITISASGAYSGFVWYHSEKIFASDCSVVKSKNEEKISTEFIFNVLKLKQQQLYNLQQGSGQPHVYPSDIKRVKIPLPNPKKQKEINNKIRDLRNQAKQLELDAEQIMTEAKEGVEKIILG